MTLLISALVLTWGTVPPGVQHAHTGGNDSSHQHSDRQDEPSHATHCHGSNGSHDERGIVSGVSLLSDFVVHLHVQWLGIDFSMPVSGDPDDGRDDPDMVPAAIVCSANRTLPAVPSFGRLLSAVIGIPSHDVVQSPALLSRGPNFTGSIPLCDSARFERSGVLLA